MATNAQVDTSFDAAALEAEDRKVQVTLGGKEFTVVDQPPAGAIIVFTRRIQKGDIQEQLGKVAGEGRVPTSGEPDSGVPSSGEPTSGEPQI